MRFFLFALFVPILFLVNSCSEQKLSRPQVAFYQAHGPTQAALHFWPYIYLVRKYESYSLDLKKAYRYTPEYSDNIHFNAADNYIEFVPLKQGPAYLRLYDGDSLRYELRIEIGADSRKDETGPGNIATVPEPSLPTLVTLEPRSAVACAGSAPG